MEDRMVSVVVVGAGMAGVSAVGELRAAGLHEVALLEAQDRPGGRIRTLDLGEKGFLELGAQFLHGRSELYYFAEQENMLSVSCSAEEAVDAENETLPDTMLQFCHCTFRTPSGEVLPSEIVHRNLQVLEDIQTEVNESLSTDVNQSVGDLLRSRVTEVKVSMLGSDEVKNAMLRWMDAWECMDSGGSLDQVSIPGLHRYKYYPGDGTRETMQGMEAVFRCLLRDAVPPSCLHVNKPVKTIHWPGHGNDTAAVTSEQNAAVITTAITTVETAQGHEKHIHTEGSSSQKVIGSEEKPRVEYGINNNLVATTVQGQQQSLKETSSDNVPEDSKRYGHAKILMENGKNQGGDHSFGVDGHHDDKGDRDANSSTPQEITACTAKDCLPQKSPNKRTSHLDCSQVRIECEDGDVFHADHVIVTSSVGFLRDNGSFFNPPLPSDHQTAVAAMGYGNVAKMFLIWEETAAGSYADQWPSRLFGDGVEGLVPLWTDDVQTVIKSAVTSKPMKHSGRQWYQDVCEFNGVDRVGLCLVAWIAGDAAVVMETLPESEVKAVLHEMLVLFLNKPDLPPPSHFIRTEWHKNRYTRGAYSYLATGVPLELHDLLSRPLPSSQMPVLQLAGEACSSHYFSTAHGALQSGRDAARVILRHRGLLQ